MVKRKLQALEELVGDTLQVEEGEYKHVAWATFVSRCHVAGQHAAATITTSPQNSLKCVACEKVVQCSPANAWALYQHVQAKAGEGSHPSTAKVAQWQAEWQHMSERLVADTEPNPSHPPPWRLEAEEDRMEEEEATAYARERPLASRPDSARPQEQQAPFQLEVKDYAGNVICRFYNKYECAKGAACNFAHMCNYPRCFKRHPRCENHEVRPL